MRTPPETDTTPMVVLTRTGQAAVDRTANKLMGDPPATVEAVERVLRRVVDADLDALARMVVVGHTIQVAGGPRPWPGDAA